MPVFRDGLLKKPPLSVNRFMFERPPFDVEPGRPEHHSSAAGHSRSIRPAEFGPGR